MHSPLQIHHVVPSLAEPGRQGVLAVLAAVLVLADWSVPVRPPHLPHPVADYGGQAAYLDTHAEPALVEGLDRTFILSSFAFAYSHFAPDRPKYRHCIRKAQPSRMTTLIGP